MGFYHARDLAIGMMSHSVKFGADKFNWEINREELAILLADGFGKDKKEVKRMIDYLLVPIRPEFLASLGGLVKIWKVDLTNI